MHLLIVLLSQLLEVLSNHGKKLQPEVVRRQPEKSGNEADAMIGWQNQTGDERRLLCSGAIYHAPPEMRSGFLTLLALLTRFTFDGPPREYARIHPARETRATNMRRQ